MVHNNRGTERSTDRRYMTQTKKGIKGGLEHIHFKSEKATFGQVDHFEVMPAEVTAPVP